MALWRLFGTTVSLVTIWLAVLFVGVFGGDIVSESDVVGGVAGTRTAVPVVVVVAALAVIATFFVAWFAYRVEHAHATAGVDLATRPDRELGSAPAPRHRPFAVGRR